MLGGPAPRTTARGGQQNAGDRAINRALRVVLPRTAVRIVHASIQRTHVHLLVQADDAGALASGMQGFQISAARQLDRELGRKRGGVFVDRYHATVIRSPVQCRTALTYTLNNWRKHHEPRTRGPEHWILDAFSSAVRFEGWREQPTSDPVPRYDPLAVAAAKSWLVRAGWAKAPALSMYATPSQRPSRLDEALASRAVFHLNLGSCRRMCTCGRDVHVHVQVPARTR